MNKNDTLLFFFILTFFCAPLKIHSTTHLSPETVVKFTNSKAGLLPPKGTITGTTTVCLNATNPIITFTGSNGTAPYTFTYKINNGADQSITTTSGDSVILTAPTNIAGSFEYSLKEIKDANNVTQNENEKVTVTINNLPTITGTFKSCIGETVTLTGSGTANASNPWISSNTAVASISNTGMITSLSSGTTTITYTDSNGCSISESFTVNLLPVVDFTFTNNSACSGATIQFNSSVSGTGPYTYLWNFGDSNTSTNANPIHNFKANNGNGNQSFNVTLTVTDTTTNCVGTIQKNVIVKQLPDLSINSSATLESFNGFPTFKICDNSSSEFVFQNISTTISTNQSYTIDWGDGSPIFNSNSWNTLNHTYSVGLWTLTYTIIGQNGCSTTKIYKAFVGSNPAVSLGNPGNTDVCIDNSLTFPITGTENNPPGTTYTINFNDGSSPEIINHPPPPSITHTFLKTSCGTTSSNGLQTFQNSFSATILASNPCGESAVGVVPIRISTPPIANFTMPTNKACINTPICFTNSSTGASVAGTTSCDTSPKIIWTISPNTGYTLAAGNQLGSDNSGNPSTNTWLTGSNSICPTFTTPGTYTITMKVGNRCGIDQITKTICIEPPLVPQFSISTTESCSPLTVTTTNNTNLIGICSTPTYLWSVTYTNNYCGSGTPVWNYASGNANSFNPTFNFITSGTYSIKLTTTNSCGSVVTTNKTVVVKQPPTVTLNPIATLCQTGITTTINPTATVVNCGTQSPLTYEWSFPGGTPSTATTANPDSISYSTSGTFSYSLKVTNECGTTTATPITFTIKPTPTSDDIPNQEQCKGQLSDAISFTGSLPGTIFNWTNNNTSIGLAATGSGNINPFTLTNTGTTVLTATITVTPTLNGCLGTPKTFTIKVNPLPALPITTPISYCQNAISTPLTATALANHTLNWYTASSGGTPLASAPTPNTTTVGTTTYYVSQTNTATGCEGLRAAKVVTINALPTVTVNSPSVCSGLSTTVTATPGTLGSYSYVWTVPAGFTNPGNVASFTTTIAGTYSVIITNTVTGCVSLSASGTVTANALPNLVINNPAAVCSPLNVDLTNSTITAGSDTGIVLSYWTNNIATTAIVSPTAISISGTYYIKATNTNGCSVIKPVTVTINQTPAITAIPSIVKCNNQAISVINFNSNVTGTSYSWTNNQPSIGLSAFGTGSIPSFTALNTGTTPVVATITVTPTANGCIGANQTFTITVNPTPTVDLPLDQEICNGLQTSIITFTGNISTITYNWTNSNSTIGLASSGTGNIPSFVASNNTGTPKVATITVTPILNGCTGTPEIFKITVNPSPAITFSPTTQQTICSGETSTLVSLSSAPGVTINWTTNQPVGITESIQTTGTTTIPAQTFTNTTNSDITIVYSATATISGVSTCLGSVYTYTIIVKPKPAITTSITQTICSNTSFSITPTNGLGNLVPVGTLYTWGAPVINPVGAITGGLAQSTPQPIISQTLNNVTNQIATATYTVIPKSGTCNGTSFQVVITVNPSPKVQFSSINQILCSGGTSSAITLSSLTTGNVTYNWTATIPAGITGATASGANMIPPQTLVNTTTTPLTVIYTATATLDANGVLCSGQALDYKITVNPSLATTSAKSNYNGFNISTVGANDGAIDVTVTGGSGVYTYLWSGPGGFSATSQDISNVPAGIYSLTINDGLCGPVVLNFILTEPQSLLIQEDLTAHINVACNGSLTGEIKVNITQQSVGPYDYLLILQGVGTIKSSISNAATNYTFKNLAAGTYDIQVKDANGSTKTITGITITEPSGIITSVLSTNHVSCKGLSDGSLSISIAGGIQPYTTILWTGPNGFTSNSTTLTNLYAGDYRLSVTDSNNCSYSKIFTISEPSLLISVSSVISNYNGQAISCFGSLDGSILVNTTGGTPPYLYSIDNGINYQNSNTFNNLKSGNYQFLVKDFNNCLSTTSIELKEPTPVILSTTISNILCNGSTNGQATVTASGGTAPYTYLWNTIPAQTTPTAINLVPGTYQVQVTDINGCKQTTTIAITEPNPLKIDNIAVTSNFNGSPISCFGASNGEITVSVSGGSAPLKYSIDNGITFQSSPIFNGLKAGSYNVLIVDNNGCSAQSNIQLIEPEKIEIIVLDVYNPTCFSSATGRLNIKITGGTPDSTGNYTFKWSNGATSLNQTDLLAGTYSITITDLNNCTQIYSITITQPNELKFTYIKTDVLCSGENSGSIELNPIGGVPNYTYQWFKDGVEFTDDRIATNLGFGIYEAIIKDRNGCYYSEKIAIDAPSALTIKSLSYQDALSCATVNSGTATVEAEGGSPFINSSGQVYYLYDWSSGETSSQANNLAPGTNWVKVIDQNGCIAQENFDINRPDDLDFKIVTSQTVSCDNKEVIQTIQVLPEGGVPPYIITFSSGTVSADPFIVTTNEPGTITIEVTDSRNCVVSKVVSVDFNELGTPSFEAQSFAFTTYEIYAVNDVITFDNTSTGDAFTVLWDFGDGTTSTELQPVHTYTDLGTYTVSLTVTYDYGCSYTYFETIEITQGYNIVVPNGFTPNDDGFNDYFKPVYVGMITARMDVYDTWGSLIYTEEGTNLKGWNGLIKNKEAENGNYFYKVMAQPFNTSTPIEIYGPFTLIK